MHCTTVWDYHACRLYWSVRACTYVSGSRDVCACGYFQRKQRWGFCTLVLFISHGNCGIFTMPPPCVPHTISSGHCTFPWSELILFLFLHFLLGSLTNLVKHGFYYRIHAFNRSYKERCRLQWMQLGTHMLMVFVVLSWFLYCECFKRHISWHIHHIHTPQKCYPQVLDSLQQ